MSVLTVLRSRRVLAGGVAIAAGTASIAAPVVAPPLSATPRGGVAEFGPSSVGLSGTYESCTALFGLTNKEDADYLTFTVSGTASPMPGIGAGLTPVVTVTQDDEVVECIPEVGFDDEASWFAYLDGDGELAQLVAPYGGEIGYLVPFFEEPTVPVRYAVRVIATDPTLTVTTDPSEYTATYPTAGELDLIVADELGGPLSALGARYLDLVADDFASCSAADPIDQALNLALVDLIGVPQATMDQLFPDLCARTREAGELRLDQIYLLSVTVAVSVTVDAPEPRPEPAPEPVAPAFTG